jgi:hypothetical protein
MNQSEKLNELQTEISEAKKHILGLKDNWDGEGSKGFDDFVFMLANARVLQVFALAAVDDMLDVFPIPAISPVADVTIDIRWKTSDFTLTLNIGDDFKVALYGKDKDGREVECDDATAEQIWEKLKLFIENSKLLS